jgi:hypothetical protein
MEALRVPLRAVGRAALAAMFITGGADALLDPGPRAPRAAELGVPLKPGLAVRLNGAIMLAGGRRPGARPVAPVGCRRAGRFAGADDAGGPSLLAPGRPGGASTSSRTSACSAGRCWRWLSGQPAAADRNGLAVGAAAGPCPRPRTGR